MRELLLGFVITIVQITTVAQVGFKTLGSEHELRINANGSIGIDLSNLSPASLIYGSEQKPILAQAGLWIVALDEDGNYHTATHYQSEIDAYDFWAGPVDTLTGQTSSDSKWNKVWKVTREDVEFHKENYQNDNYVTSEAISSWPAEGEGSFSQYLAPFVDANNDGKYEPLDGDYPDIKGVSAAYCIFNDVQSEHDASFGAELGIEVHLMVYLPSEFSSHLLEYFIINRRPTTYQDIQVGFFIDGECGNRNDNYAGTFESFPQSIFVYHADERDEGFFEQDKPYVLATFLNENLGSSIAFNDSENQNGKPTTNAHFINYAHSRWKDSSVLTYGGDGTEGVDPTDFIFAQRDDNHLEMWTEDNAGNPTGSRTVVGFTNYTNFRKGEFIKMNIGLNGGIVDENLTSREQILNSSKSTNNSFRQTNSIPELKYQTSLFPNPNSGSFTLISQEIINSINIYSRDGLLLESIDCNSFSHNIRNLNHPSGVYIIEAFLQSGLILRKKLIISKI